MSNSKHFVSCSLLKPTIKSIKEHLDLIDATDMLVGQYHVMNDEYTRVLPIQIRLHNDRIQFIRLLLLKHPELYKKHDWLLDLLKKLIGDTPAVTPRSKYLIQIFKAQAALKLNSYEDAFKILMKISEKTLKSDILVVEELEMFGNEAKRLALSPYSNDEGKLALLSTAVTNSSAFNIPSLLPVWRKTYIMSKLQKYHYFTGKTPQEAYILLQNQIGKKSGEKVVQNESCQESIDFYKPVGSILGDFYAEKDQNEAEKLEMQSASKLVHMLSLFHQIQESDEYNSKWLLPNLLKEDIPLAFSHMLITQFVSVLGYFNLK